LPQVRRSLEQLPHSPANDCPGPGPRPRLPDHTTTVSKRIEIREQNLTLELDYAYAYITDLYTYQSVVPGEKCWTENATTANDGRRSTDRRGDTLALCSWPRGVSRCLLKAILHVYKPINIIFGCRVINMARKGSRMYSSVCYVVHC